MRNKVAKKLKMDVALALYGGDGVSKKDIRDDKKEVFSSPDLKTIYRAKKKNIKRKTHQGKLATKGLIPQEVINKMMEARKKQETYKKKRHELV